ncbi:MAG: YggS family pyridoxal phosphate-dependent enzyme [Chloroflexi bacterium]|nr:YggS family pyridoxal phosphate-dependent enzyme [Chloroflexota bacterium]
MGGPPGRDGSLAGVPDPALVAAYRAARAGVLDAIAAAAARAGRDPSGVTLVAVSKTVEPDRVRAAVAAGCTVLGENRVQEGETKRPAVPGATWHLIGPLQANKARRAIETFDVIETVDSLALASRLDRIVREVRGLPVAGGVDPALRLRVLLQANVDDDPAKAGFDPSDLARDLPEIETLGALDILGLMTVGRLVSSAEAARPTFGALRELSLRLRERPGSRLGPALSMGMSHDFSFAVEEGATSVRVGTAIFGARPPAAPADG